MHNVRTILGLLISTACLATAQAAPSPDPSQGRAEILQLADAFQKAILAKDAATLRGLFLTNSSWTQIDATAPGAAKRIPGNYREFTSFVSSGKQHYEERFSNLRVETDGTIAELYFNYVFLIDSKESNSGDETWHLVKTAVGWKIAALTYSVTALAPIASGTVAAAPVTSDARAQLLEFERAWSIAEIKHDVPVLKRILDDHFICTFGAAAPLNKDQFIQVIVGLDVLSQEPSDASVVIDRDLGVIVDTFTVRGTEAGKPYTRVYRITATYVRHDGQWQALAEQVASVD